VAGRSCLAIVATVHVLAQDAGLADAACLAVVTALQHFRRPDVSVAGERVTVHGLGERAPVPLSMLHHPLCVTLSFVGAGAVLLVDATAAEARVADGQLLVTANRLGEVCQIAKLGGAPADALGLLRCVAVAVRKAAELDAVMRAALEAEERRRDVGDLLKELSAANAR